MDMEAIYRDISYRYVTDKILFVVFTSDTMNARVLVNSGLKCWLYNTAVNRLEIYQGQPLDFYNVRQIIGELQYPQQQQQAQQKKKRERTKIKHKILNFTNLFILINVVVHIILEIIGNPSDPEFMLDKGAIFVEKILEGEVYRFLTSMFMHFDFAHLAGNMFVLFMVGINLENMIGRWKVGVIYMVSGLGASIVATTYYLIADPNVVCAGASGAVYGIVGALVWAMIIYAKERKFILWQVIVGAALSLGQGFVVEEGVSLSAHLGGFIIGFLIALIMCRKRGVKHEN